MDKTSVFFGKIIDSHTHASLKPKYGFKKGTINDLLEDMGSAGISKALVFSGVDDEEMWGKYEYPLKDMVKDLKNNDKLYVVATLDIKKNIELQLKEIEKYIIQGKVKAIKILLGYYQFYPTDKIFHKVYDFCIKHNVPVIFHTGDTILKGAKIKYAHPIHIDDLAADRPNLKIVIAHLGNPWILDAAAVMYKNDNVYGDISGLFMGKASQAYSKLLFRKLHDLIAYVGGCDKILYGTDFPLVDSKTYIDFVMDLGLSDSDLEKIFFKNAQRVFNLT